MISEFDLMVAPTGARLQKTVHSAVPITVDEVVQTAIACEQAGASKIHIHVRDKSANHSIDPDLYNAATAAVAEQSRIGIQVSTEAAGVFEVPAQLHCIKNVMAKDVSVSVREIMREPDGLVGFYELAVSRGISIQHILYDQNDLLDLQKLLDQGKIPDELDRVIFVLGRYSSGMQSSPSDLNPFIQGLGDYDLDWSVCAFGNQEHDCLLAALDQGGNVRIGFENSFTASDGTIFPDNETSVSEFVEAASKSGFKPRRIGPQNHSS